MKEVTLEEQALFLFRKERRNCAEAIAEAWQQVTGGQLELADQLGQCGFGEAPQGLCGAVYAAQLVAAQQRQAEIVARFADSAGSLLCREIRAAKNISCTNCVRLAARLLDQSLQNVPA